MLSLREYEAVTACAPAEAPGPTPWGVRVGNGDFQALKRLALAGEDDGPSAAGLLELCLRHGREALRARSYAGLLLAPSGLCLEILPKIAATDSGDALRRARALFLKMLRRLPDAPFRIFREAELAGGEFPLLETFIACFLREAGDLVRRGIAGDYAEHEGNLRFLRGKLRLNEHLRRNAARRERFYVRYDAFSTDRPENRLIRTALDAVFRWSRERDNRRRCALLRQSFEGVPLSADLRADFARCRRERNLAHYDRALSWCRLLLGGRAPLPQAGTHACVSLLFPLERVFERYVTENLRQALRPEGWDVTAQTARRWLVESYKGKPAFSLRPDLLLARGDRQVVADIKWKRIAAVSDINHHDLHQMFAYMKTCLPETGRQTAFLIYPHHEAFPQAPLTLHFRENACVLHVVSYDPETDACPLPGLLASLPG